jgi:hypothetical protein
MCTFVLAATATVIDYPVNRNNRWNYECCLTIISPETTALYRKRSRVLKTTTAVSTIHDELTNQSDQIEILLYLEKDRKCGPVIYCSFNSRHLNSSLQMALCFNCTLFFRRHAFPTLVLMTLAMASSSLRKVPLKEKDSCSSARSTACQRWLYLSLFSFKCSSASYSSSSSSALVAPAFIAVGVGAPQPASGGVALRLPPPSSSSYAGEIWPPAPAPEGPWLGAASPGRRRRFLLPLRRRRRRR